MEPVKIVNMRSAPQSIETAAFQRHVAGQLYRHGRQNGCMPPIPSQAKSSVVFLLIGSGHTDGRRAAEPCLILTKRSQQVRQPGDLCCPGGGITPYLDNMLSRLLALPASPLRRWICWRRWQRRHSQDTALLRLLMATALREGWEEMRLNPLKIKFMGLLPVQQLILFNRWIYPLVGWVSHQKQFRPNWEVAKVVSVPLSHLLNPERYALYRLALGTTGNNNPAESRDFTCFHHKTATESELLWGATFRIVADFLKIVYNFSPPLSDHLPVIEGQLDANYLGR